MSTLPAISEDARVIEIHIPLPPSQDKAWANNKSGKGRGRFKTKAYTAWEREALWPAKMQFQKQGGETITGPCKVEMLFQRKSMLADVSNRIKITEDMLQTIGVVLNDRQVVKVSAEWAPIQGAVVRVEELK